ELFWEAGAALLPILIFFAVFQLVFLKIHSRGIRRIGFGVIYTIIGHTLFLTGVFTGFLPAGEYLGGAIAALPGNYKLILIPAAMLIGGLAVTAEPGVHMLRHQVEEVTVGAINKETITAVAVISAAAASGLAMLRILTGISIWYFLIGGYAVSLVLSFFVPRMFTAIAFDSGIMISGSMTVAFLLPFAKGAGGVLASSAEALLTDAFGLVALVVTAPMMAIQLLGLVYKLKLSGSPLLVRAETDEVRVIEFDKEGSI
ncbi:MAG: DUF1538 domain-containing protein, partial [Clostridia bacterium]|nr:DUF1538 domain-containing protein [Clostridia bacterium]